MKKNLIFLGMGVILGLLLYHLFGASNDKRSDAQRDNSGEATVVRKASPAQLHKENVAPPKTPPPLAHTPPNNDSESRVEKTDVSATYAAMEKKRVLNFEISEPEVFRMESNLDSLQNEVSLFREEHGWVVKFYENQNALAEAGIRDGDLIRFQHLEKMKQNPRTADLAHRLEDVLFSLQR